MQVVLAFIQLLLNRGYCTQTLYATMYVAIRCSHRIFCTDAYLH